MARRDLDKVRRAAERLRQAEDDLAVAVAAAKDSGETLRDIAGYANMSHQQVDRLVERVKERAREAAGLDEVGAPQHRDP